MQCDKSVAACSVWETYSCCLGLIIVIPSYVLRFFYICVTSLCAPEQYSLT